MIYSYDDAVNSAGDLVINDGYIFSQATKNDGLDSNGNMTFNGGVVVAAGSSSPECGIDVNTEGRAYMTINGGTIIGIGGGNNTPSYGLQCYALYGTSGMGGGGMGGGRPGSGSSSSSSGSVSSGTTYVLTDGKTPALVFKSEVSGSSFLISTPALTKNTSYTLTKGASVSGGDDFCGLVTGATVTGGTTVTTLTAKQP